MLLTTRKSLLQPGVLALIACCSCGGNKQDEGRIVASVNGESIRAEDIEKGFRADVQRAKATAGTVPSALVGELWRRRLEERIDEVVVRGKAKALSVTIPL